MRPAASRRLIVRSDKTIARFWRKGVRVSGLSVLQPVDPNERRRRRTRARRRRYLIRRLAALVVLVVLVAGFAFGAHSLSGGGGSSSRAAAPRAKHETLRPPAGRPVRRALP